ncbi:hypothetical protein BD289DRAFT_458936 [Coniella lustricola]|uniref:protein-histidine N-methyltransferase n=1 Tax=Coniella lustricola TaxID=2025994 RepID=A0A2T3AH89_9PEZI|nr:hypothetical protein BD289DRAFT_458936 [Coniella lustricola]
MSFSFSFSGDDIEAETASPPHNSLPTAVASPPSSAASAFPVQGKPQLPPVHHDLNELLATLPSKIAYSILDVDLDGSSTVQIPRRELWDVRVQLMAEDDGHSQGEEIESGLGSHDVKTGIYEGGFKSWESSVDLVKVLAAENVPRSTSKGPVRFIELGCGTALPSLALFQWTAEDRAQGQAGSSQLNTLSLTLADYNPSVLRLVTLPNFLLAWALHQQSHDAALQDALSSIEGELEINEQIVESFKAYLLASKIELNFVSGGWCPEFVNLIYSSFPTTVDSAIPGHTLIIGAETIYSPFALSSFTTTLLDILQRERDSHPMWRAVAIVAAKRLYFGVGGSLDDFVAKIRDLGAAVGMLREETEGVRRGVVQCSLS